MSEQHTTTIDEDRLMSFVFRAVDEVGATLNAALVVMGDKLGYYEQLATRGPLTAAELAEATGTQLPYAREWLNGQAAGRFVDYDPATERYALPSEHAVALTGLGFLIAWWLDSTQGFHAIMNLLLVPMWLLSGAVFPPSGAAPWVRGVMAANPMTYGVAALQTVLLGRTDGPSLGVSLVVTALFGAAMLVAGVILVDRRRLG